MNKYLCRKNFTASISDHEKIIRGKLAFKTKETDWIETNAPVIAIVSIHSSFHEGIGGDLKMNAFISTIKNHVKGRVTILLSDRAHIQTLSLSYSENYEVAFQKCLSDSRALVDRYQPYFEGCHVTNWDSYICQDGNYSQSIQQIKSLYETDNFFRVLLNYDAEATYTKEREQSISNKELFIEKAIGDLIEQNASVLVLAQKGYRFQFYPGKPFASVEYVSHTLVSQDQPLSWIDVFLTIEKKTISHSL